MKLARFGTRTSQILKHGQKRFVSDVSVTIKFTYEKNVEEVVGKKGKLVSKDSGVVEYYDRVPPKEAVEGQELPKGLYELSCQDTWLQKVNGKEWRCRAPHGHEVTKETHLLVERKKRIPKYKLLNGEGEIRRELNIQQDKTKPETCKSLDDDLQDRGIIPYAAIKTKVAVYELEQGEKVQLTETDFGYQYGTVSKKCKNAKVRELKQTTQELEQLVKELGGTMTPYIREDIEEYIHKNNKAHYDTLIKSDILADQL